MLYFSYTLAKIAASLEWGTPLVYSKIKKQKGLPCPGVWDEITSNTEPFVRILTVGPGSDAQLSLTSFVRGSAKSAWSGAYDDAKSALQGFSPFDKNDIEVLVVSDDQTNVKDLDVSSLRFGRGEAKPVSVKRISVAKEMFSASQHQKSSQGKDALLLSFKASEVNPLCDVDLALFLNGKTADGKDFFSGVAVRKTPCTLENWKEEAKKILYKESSAGNAH